MPVSDYVTGDRVKDPHQLDLLLEINGKAVQSDSTNLMLFTIPVLLEYISGFMTLNEGDLLLTGTPKGVGPIKPGDKLYGALKQGEEVLADFKFDVNKE